MELFEAGATRREFLRRNVAIGGTALLGGSLATVLDACGSSSSSSSTSSSAAHSGLTLAQVQQASGTIKVYGWQFYEVPKAQDNGPVKSKWTPIASSTEIPTKIKPPGTFDVFISNSNQMGSFFPLHRMVPINTSLLPNYDAIVAVLRNDPAWKGPGGIYAVPFAVTPGVTGYDSSKVAPPQTMNDLLNPDLKGQVGVYDDPSVLFQFARGLGIGDPLHPQNITPDQLPQVTDYLNKLRPQVKTLYPFGGEAQLFNRGDIKVAFQTFGSLLTSSSKNGAKVKASFLGSVSFVDALSILNDANMAASYNWINNAISKQAQVTMAANALTNPVVGQASGLPAPLNAPLAVILKHAPVLGPAPPVAPSGFQYVSLEDLNNAWTNFKSNF
jgi:putative spermidine/putrescine transport system substrate-binding protein